MVKKKDRGLLARPEGGREEQPGSSGQRQKGKEEAEVDAEVPELGEEDIALDGDHMYSLQAATTTEIPNLSESSDVVMNEIERYTDDDEVAEDFAERQQLNTGRDELQERIEEHTAQSPELSGGDIDASWDDSIVSGEESVGGTSPTPDQDTVDELGAALGIDYADNEVLNTVDKLNRRDQNRLDLSPSSVEDAYELDDEEDDLHDLLTDELDEDLEDEDQDDLEDEFPHEIEDELAGDLDEEDEDLEEDEEDKDDEGYEFDELGEEDDDDLYDDFDEDEDEDED